MFSLIWDQEDLLYPWLGTRKNNMTVMRIPWSGTKKRRCVFLGLGQRRTYMISLVRDQDAIAPDWVKANDV